MRKWKNPYITLMLSPTASDEEIRKQEKNFASSNAEKNAKIARAAREDLTQNVNKMFPAFLTAIPGLFSIENDVKSLRKRYRRNPDLSDEILAKGFAQMGLKFEQKELSENEIDTSVMDQLKTKLTINQHKELIDSLSKKSIEDKQANNIHSNELGKIQIPLLVKDE
ncbi:MAG: hypothetical protein DWQ10_03635 [Calditrichaeota bacterium]|nr:MAG: hypothetical protein DWQ10_03635 [Calditrichota bacterium]